jgi:DNA polymerase III subunit beta
MEHISHFEAATELSIRVTVDRAPLFKALDLICKRVIERRSTIPILSNVMISAAIDGSMSIMGTDLDIQAVATIPAQCDWPGTFTVDANMIRVIVKGAAKDARILLSCSDGKLIIRFGNIKQTIPTLPADEFPVLAPPTVGICNRFTLSGEWARDFAAVAPAMAVGEGAHWLRGQALAVHRNRLHLVATDGHQMAIVDRPCPIGAESLPDCIIPRIAVELLIAATKKEIAAPVDVVTNGKRITFTLGSLIITSKLVDSSYPNYLAGVESGCGDVAPSLVEKPLLDPRLPHDQIAKLEKASGCTLSVENAQRCALLTSPDYPEFMGCVMHIDGVEGQSVQTVDVPDGDKKISQSKAQVAAMCDIDYLFATVAIRMIDGSTGYVLQWILDQGDGKMWTVRKDGRTFSDADRWQRATVTREFALAGGTPIGEIQSDTPPSAEYEAEKPESLSQRWAREDAFIGPKLPVAVGNFIDEGYPGVIASGGCWYAQEGKSAHCTGPYANLIEARRASIRPTETQGAVLAIQIAQEPVEALSDDLAEDLGHNVAPESDWVCNPSAYDPESDPKHDERETPDREQEDWQAFMMARFGELEAKVTELSGKTIISATTNVAENLIETPFGGISDAPSIGAKERSPAHVRAIMRYLAMRKHREDMAQDFHKEIVIAARISKELELVRSAGNKACDERLALRCERDELQGQLQRMNTKRRRAVMNARDLQTRLYAEHKIVDRHAEKRREAEHCARNLSVKEQSERDAKDRYMRMANDIGLQLHDAKRGRINNAKTARRWSKVAWQMTREVDRMETAHKAELATSKLSPSYMHPEGRELPDIIALSSHRANYANDRADTLSRELETARGAIGGMKQRIDQMADEMMTMTGRALRAETALSATTARVNGWPPAVSSVQVKFGKAA